MVEVELENNLTLQDDECCSSKSDNSEPLGEDEELKEINTLTKDQEFLFDVICKLPNNKDKKIYLQRFKTSIEKPLTLT